MPLYHETNKSIIQKCEDCQSIDPALAWWEKGRIDVGNNWYRLSMDITHYSGNGFLTLTDCGLTHFPVWCQLVHQNASSIVRELKSIFFESSMPAEILSNNAPAFYSQTFLTLADEWGIQMQYWSAYVLEGISITEQCHHTVKGIATRSCCLIPEAVYWYNVTPKNNKTLSSTPTNGIYQYEQRMKGIDHKLSPPEVKSYAYQVGEPECWCTTRFCKGQVDGVISPQTVLVNGTLCHVKDLCRCNKSAVTKEDENDTFSGSKMGVMVTCESEGQHSSAQGTEDENNQTSGDGGNAGNLMEEHPTLPQRSTGKHMVTLNELILQLVTYFHAGSHIKPWRVKMRMQMRAGRKEHKNNKHHHSASFVLDISWLEEKYRSV